MESNHNEKNIKNLISMYEHINNSGYKREKWSNYKKGDGLSSDVNVNKLMQTFEEKAIEREKRAYKPADKRKVVDEKMNKPVEVEKKVEILSENKEDEKKVGDEKEIDMERKIEVDVKEGNKEEEIIEIKVNIGDDLIKYDKDGKVVTPAISDEEEVEIVDVIEIDNQSVKSLEDETVNQMDDNCRSLDEINNRSDEENKDELLSSIKSLDDITDLDNLESITEISNQKDESVEQKDESVGQKDENVEQMEEEDEQKDENVEKMEEEVEQKEAGIGLEEVVEKTEENIEKKCEDTEQEELDAEQEEVDVEQNDEKIEYTGENVEENANINEETIQKKDEDSDPLNNLQNEFSSFTDEKNSRSKILKDQDDLASEEEIVEQEIEYHDVPSNDENKEKSDCEFLTPNESENENEENYADDEKNDFIDENKKSENVIQNKKNENDDVKLNDISGTSIKDEVKKKDNVTLEREQKRKDTYESARKELKKYRKSEGFFSKFFSLITCGCCDSSVVENTTPVNPDVFKLIGYLGTNCSNVRQLFRCIPSGDEYEEILEKLNKNEPVNFCKYTAVENTHALKLYIRDTLDGILDVEMTKIMLEIVNNENFDNNIIKEYGKKCIQPERLKLLYSILFLFVKINKNYENTGMTYDECTVSIASTLFPRSIVFKDDKSDLYEIVRLICDSDDLYEISILLED